MAVLLIVPILSLAELPVNAAKTDVLFGDVNGDGVVDNTDVVWIRSFIGRVISFSEEQKIIADVNGDGEVDLIDKMYIDDVANGQDVYSLPIYGELLDAGVCGVNLTGDNVKYILKKDGSLILFGEGEIFDNLNTYIDVSLEYVPWYSHKSSIKTIEIKSGVTIIGKRVFERTPNLTKVVIPDSVVSIHQAAFAYCESLTEITLPDNLTIIEQGVFERCTSLNSIVIPKGVTRIDKYGFERCTNLTSITFSGNLTEIGESAFYGCTCLSEVTFPDSLTKIEWGAFKGCTGLKSILIPEKVTGIAGEAFVDCLSLESIKVAPDNTVYDSRNNCNAIIYTATDTLRVGCINTVIPNGIKIVGADAFYDCSGLESITLPNTLTAIGDYAFNNCTSLKQITFPDSLTKIGESAFRNCTGLKSLTIPAGVTKFGYFPAFSGCTGLTSIKVDKDNPVYDSRNDCNAIIETASNSLLEGCKSTVIPDTVSSISWYAFSGCTELTDITIPGSVTKIGEEAFMNCKNLKNVTIADGVTSISMNAFLNCTGLTKIIIPESVSFIDTKALGYYYDEKQLKIPGFTIYGIKDSTAESYANSNGFAFEEIQEATIPTTIPIPEKSGKITVGSVSGETGDTVAVKINIADNPSITSLQIKVGYSSDDLELLEVVDNELFDSPITHSKNLSDNPQTISWYSSKSADVSVNGTFATLRFRIKEGAKTSQVTLSYDPENIFDSQFTNKSFSVENGTVTVEEPLPDNCGRFVVESKVNEVEGLVDVDISIENNPSITAFQWEISYPESELELLEITDRGILDSPITHSKSLSDYPQIISWFSSKSADTNVNGAVVTLHFKIKDNKKYTGVTLSYQKENVFNSRFEDVDFKIVYRDAPSVLVGDANGDGVVNISDATTVQKHIAQLIELEGACLKAADANGDSVVNINDVTQIQKYIAQLIDHLG